MTRRGRRRRGHDGVIVCDPLPGGPGPRHDRGVLRIDDEERRARLARRHGVAPDARRDTVEAAAGAMVGLHATDPAGLFLSAWARVDGFTVPDLERALYGDRTLVKHMVMRRTLFAVPRDSMPVVQVAASRRIAAAERRRLERELGRAGLVDDPARWFDAAATAVVRHLGAGEPLTSTQLRERIPELDLAIAYGEGRSWAGRAGVGPRVLTCLQAAGTVLRAGNVGPWTTSRPTWALTRDWLGADLPELDEDAARADLVAGWLRAFGPGTVRDLRWWLGSTVAAVRRALADVGAVEVELDGGTGHVLPDDVEPVGAVDPWVALLPGLDPTTMGWTERGWYLGPHGPQVFDSIGNAGPTIWVDGRVVGGWTVTPTGDVELALLEDVGRDARRAIDAEAERLTTWLDGTAVRPRFPPALTRGR